MKSPFGCNRGDIPSPSTHSIAKKIAELQKPTYKELESELKFIHESYDEEKDNNLTRDGLCMKIAALESRRAKAQALLDHYFGDGWKDPEFEASEFDTCDSIYTSNGLAKLFREALGGSST